MSSRFESLTGTVDRPFPEYDAPPPEPLELMRRWIADAVTEQVREPLALALATADRLGRASTRIVAVMNDLTAPGLMFSTHSSSRKGKEIEETGWASGLLYWRETGQQVSVSGPVRRLSDAEASRHWDARPAPLHAMSTVSHQSDPLEDTERLREEASRLAGSALPRPDSYAVYLIEPASVEFWSAGSDRLHRRLRYDLTSDGWTVERLQP